MARVPAPLPGDPHYRPLLSSIPRPTASGQELDLGGETVTVTGEPGEVARILGYCDGTRTVAEIAQSAGVDDLAEVAGLIEELAQRNAVVDCAEAWKIFHAQSSTETRLWRPVPAEELEELAQGFELPRTGAEAVRLEAAPTAIDALTRRRRSSWPDDGERPVDFRELCALLWVMYSGAGRSGRPVPSGGGLYPLALHLVLRDPVPPLEVGVWWYEPAQNLLHRIRDAEPELGPAFVPMENTVELLARRRPVIVISADVARAARKYANRAYRLALIEVGALMQNAYLAATDLEVPIRAMLGINDDPMIQLLDLPPGTVPLLALFTGT